MVPQTYPSQLNSSTGRREMIVSFLSSVTGLKRWTDYIPVAFVSDDTPTEDSFDNDGYIAVSDIGSTTGKQSFVDYIPVYVDPVATDAWQVNSVGFIQIGTSGLGGIPQALFKSGEQGTWYDPSDLTTLYQDSAGTTPVTAVEQPVGLMLDKSKGGVGTNGASRRNLLTYSESFDNAAWLKSNATITADATTAPDVTLTADKLVDGGSGSVTHVLSSAQVSTTNSSPVTGSIYVKQGEYSTIAIGVAEGSPYASYVVYTFDLIAKTATQTSIGTGAASQSAAITPVGNGWYRCSVSVTLNGTSSTSFLKIFNKQFAAYTGDGTSGIYIWGAQLEAGSTATTYQKITSDWVSTLPGNHAFQTTTTSRPVLSARYNLLTKTEQFDDAVWTKTNATVTANVATAPDGTLTASKLIENTASSTHSINQVVASSQTSFCCSVYVKAGERRRVFIRFDDGGSTNIRAYTFDVISGSITVNVDGTTGTLTSSSAFITSVGNGWYRCGFTGVFSVAPTSVRMQMFVTNDTGGTNYTGDGTSGIYIWGASLVPSNQASLPYQRVDTATDYDTVGFKPYLKFDGVDDFLVTNSIDFTSTDKMHVCAGVRKLSDATTAALLELSTNKNSNNGVFSIFSPIGAGTSTYTWTTKGTLEQGGTSDSGYASPNTAVLSGIGAIGNDVAALRINGMANGSVSGSDQGTGNYGNYPLYIGRRGGTTLPFNGQLYSLVIRGSASTDAQIAATERYVNGKTGAY